MSPIALLWLSLAVPGDAPVPAGFVFSPTLTVNFNPLVPIPSGDLSLFLGGTLPIRPRRPDHWLALGYRGAVSGGLADLGTTAPVLYWLGHRHHVALHGVAGEHSRLVYGADLGLSVFHLGVGNDEGESVPPRALALELEVRVGRVVGLGDPRIAAGIVGLQIRLAGAVWPFTAPPFPTIGLFFGVHFGRRLPPAPRRPRDPPPPAANTPRDSDGDGLLDPLDRCPRDAGDDPVGCPELDTDPDGAFELPPAP